MSLSPISHPLGTHLLLELYGCKASFLNDSDAISAAMVKAAEEGGATIVETVFHRFSKQGVSGVVVIAESHLTVHTWPEHNYAAIDVFTCGNHDMPKKIADSLQKLFGAERSSFEQYDRGLAKEEEYIASTV